MLERKINTGRTDRRRAVYSRVLAFAGAIAGGSCALLAADATTPAFPPSTQFAATQAADDLISLNFSDSVELKMLIEYVSQRVGVNILYDEQVGTQRISLKTPVKIPRSALMGVLESVLKAKGFLLVDSDQPGLKRVVPAAGMATLARPTTQGAVPTTQGNGALAAGEQVVAQVFTLKYADPQKLEQAIKSFLTTPGGSSVALSEQRMLVVTDLAPNVQRIAELVQLIDQPKPQVDVQFIPVQHVEASQLATAVNQILSAKAKAQGVPAAGQPSDTVELTQDARTNNLILIGGKSRLEEVLKIIHSLDVPMDAQTHIYHLKVASPERIDRLAKELIGQAEAKRLYESAVDQEGNMLVVTAPEEIQKKVQELVDQLDVTVAAEQSPIRFYKLTNTTAADVLETIRAIEGDETSGSGGGATTQASQGQPAPLAPGGNRPPPAAGQPPYEPPSLSSGGVGSSSMGQNSLASGIQPGLSQPTLPMSGSSSSGASSGGRQSVRMKHGTAAADPNTNSIIIVADPASQQMYEQLISRLDKRRPQVLVECTLVTLDTSHNFTFGMELSANGKSGATQFLSFSSFGLSTVDAKTGQLTIEPGTGFNGTIIGGDTASLVIQALSTDSRARVLSAPRILVNDNAAGTLSSVAEEPFTSVNASTTVATTSFAGYASAGTTISLTPHISEADHLQLEYAVTLSSFSGTSSNGVPPPRTTNTIESKVTIPDGYTVVIGGLNRTNFSDTVNRVPILGDIPFLGALFSDRNKTESTSTLFVFLRPIILRDDKFEDLKFLSEHDLKQAGVAGNFPHSEPMSMR